MRRRYWLYKNNGVKPGPAGYYGHWRTNVFDQDRELEWGGDYATRSMEVHNNLATEVRPGDVVVAYQTETKEVVGFCKVTQVTGAATGQVDVHKPKGRKIWLRPIELLRTPLRLHEVKRGTVLQDSPAVNGPIMLSELTADEMRELVARSGAPRRVMGAKAAPGGYRPPP